MEFRFRLEARAKLKVEESAISKSVNLVKADFEKQPLSAQDNATELVPQGQYLVHVQLPLQQYRQTGKRHRRYR
jgi:hypothetical protein